MRAALILVLLLAGCVSPDVQKSLNRDKTMENIAKAALINEMLNSRDPVIRSKGADAAAEFLKKEKRSIFD